MTQASHSQFLHPHCSHCPAHPTHPHPHARSPFRARSPLLYISKRAITWMEFLFCSEAPSPCLLSVSGLAALGLGIQLSPIREWRWQVAMSYRAQVCSRWREAWLTWERRVPKGESTSERHCPPTPKLLASFLPHGCPCTLLGISAMLTPTVACGEVVHPPEWWVGTWAESLRRVTRERTGRGSSRIPQVSATQATLFCLQHSNGGFSQLAGG